MATTKLPTFDQVYACLQKHGPARVTSSRGTRYDVYAEYRKGGPIIIAYPRKSEIRIHKDDWGKKETRQGTWAGGVYSGKPSIYDWFRSNCPHSE
jgi:hypothetical protein